jgi:hypothetical protein
MKKVCPLLLELGVARESSIRGRLGRYLGARTVSIRRCLQKGYPVVTLYRATRLRRRLEPRRTAPAAIQIFPCCWNGNLSLVPSLFQAAKDAKKMAANMILAGLLNCDHLNDPRRGQLRMRSALD